MCAGFVAHGDSMETLLVRWHPGTHERRDCCLSQGCSTLFHPSQQGCVQFQLVSTYLNQSMTNFDLFTHQTNFYLVLQFIFRIFFQFCTETETVLLRKIVFFLFEMKNCILKLSEK